MTPFEKIAILEKQIDRLRKEVDERIGSNNTLWRATLAGLGALILLKESVDFDRVMLILPVLTMILAAYWLNQIITLFRSGVAMAKCEGKINKLVGETLLNYEITLTASRRRAYYSKRWLILAATVVISAGYWWLLLHIYSAIPSIKILAPFEVAVGIAAFANIVAAINSWRLCVISGITSTKAISKELD